VEKVWLAQYPAGVPHDIGSRRHSSLAALVEDSCRRFHALPAFSSMGTVMTYAELDRQSRSFGAYLQRERGMRPGDRMAIVLPNLLQYRVALFGALRAGVVAVSCNPLYTTPGVGTAAQRLGRDLHRGPGKRGAHAAGDRRQDSGEDRHRHRCRRHAAAGQGVAHEFRCQTRQAIGRTVANRWRGALSLDARPRRPARLRADTKLPGRHRPASVHGWERGYIKITDRKKDTIVVSGFKVFPSEVEDVVASHPACSKWRR